MFPKDFFDDKQDNWKNSEVMRLFTEQYYQNTLENVESDIGKENNEVLDDSVVEETEHNFEFDMIKAELHSQLESVLDKLTKLSYDSSKYNNQKVSYMIEKVAYKIKDLVQEINPEEI